MRLIACMSRKVPFSFSWSMRHLSQITLFISLLNNWNLLQLLLSTSLYWNNNPSMGMPWKFSLENWGFLWWLKLIDYVYRYFLQHFPLPYIYICIFLFSVACTTHMCTSRIKKLYKVGVIIIKANYNLFVFEFWQWSWHCVVCTLNELLCVITNLEWLKITKI